MGQSQSELSTGTTEKRCNGLDHGATDCTDGLHARVAHAIWRHKTAEHWAAAAGKKPRIAKYWLAGGHISEAAKLAIIRILS